MEFADKKPLGKQGFRWLKIHLANLMGYDKASFDDREKYTEENMDLLRDSVLHPLEGEMWWLDADYPWQALAVMMEINDIVNAHENEGLPIEEYMSGIPVHQDGSCNGLQHYAALGRDVNGAAAVNLIATEDGKPADVYSRILDVVLERIEEDSLLHEIPGGAYGYQSPDDLAYEDEVEDRKLRNKLARLLKGNVDRKMVKQTVMTSVYGVTRRGARDQVQRRIAEKIEDGKMLALVESSLGEKQEQNNLQFKAAAYVANLALDSIGTVFREAQSIMDWLAEMANKAEQQSQSSG